MTRSIRHAAALLALAAMLLRAAIPAGWMPSAAGDAPLTMCTASGLVVLQGAASPGDAPGATATLDGLAQDGQDSSDPHASAHIAPCAFAASATLAGSNAHPLTLPGEFHAQTPSGTRASPARKARPPSNHPARAPPTFS